MNPKSQRLFALLVVLLQFIVGIFYGISNHTLPTLSDSSSLITVVTPLGLVIVTLKHLFDVIDSKVTSGVIKPGDIITLLTMNEFYVAMVTCFSGVLQGIGLKVIDPTAQALLVDTMMGLSNILLRSFSNRPPLAEQPLDTNHV